MTAHGGWMDVLDVQLDLIRFWRSQAGELAAIGFGESMAKVEAERGNLSGDWLAHRLQPLMLDMFMVADPFYVDPDLMTLVEAAADAFRPEPLQATDLLTAHGFVVLPRALTMFDRHGKACKFRAFAWRSVQMQYEDGEHASDGVLLALFSHLDDEDDYPLDPDEKRDILARTGMAYHLLHVTPWEFGQDVPRSHEQNFASWWPPVQAFLRLALQTISDRYQQRPPRAAMRRWQRAKLPVEDKYVTVIRLRRPRSANKSEEGEPVQWTHRWIVSGHWRNQYYPSLQMRRQIWIGTYIKGPSDVPLLVRRGRAFEFVR